MVGYYVKLKGIFLRIRKDGTTVLSLCKIKLIRKFEVLSKKRPFLINSKSKLILAELILF